MSAWLPLCLVADHRLISDQAKNTKVPLEVNFICCFIQVFAVLQGVPQSRGTRTRNEMINVTEGETK